jgi:predicted aconitase with swiveling domain
VPGALTGEALVTHQGFNTLASLKTAGSFLNPKGEIQDANNPELYHKLMPGKILCLPETIGSTTGGMVLYCAASMGVGPKAMLFSKPADSLAVAGAVLTYNWTDKPIVLVDSLGEEFLAAVREGQTVTVAMDGTVTLEGD